MILTIAIIVVMILPLLLVILDVILILTKNNKKIKNLREGDYFLTRDSCNLLKLFLFINSDFIINIETGKVLSDNYFYGG